MNYKKCDCNSFKDYTCISCKKEKEFVNKPVKPAKTPAPLHCESKEWDTSKRESHNEKSRLKTKVCHNGEWRDVPDIVLISKERAKLNQIEKLSNELLDYLGDLNSSSTIDYNTYSELSDRINEIYFLSEEEEKNE